MIFFIVISHITLTQYHTLSQSQCHSLFSSSCSLFMISHTSLILCDMLWHALGDIVLVTRVYKEWAYGEYETSKQETSERAETKGEGSSEDKKEKKKKKKGKRRGWFPVVSAYCVFDALRFFNRFDCVSEHWLICVLYFCFSRVLLKHHSTALTRLAMKRGDWRVVPGRRESLMSLGVRQRDAKRVGRRVPESVNESEGNTFECWNETE